MHICYVTAEYPILNFSHGGIGTFVRNLGYELVKKGHKITVIRISKVQEYELILDKGVEVHILPQSKFPLSFIFNSIGINKTIKNINTKNKIDVVETSELGLAFINKINGIKYVIRMHGGHHYFSLAEKRELEWRKVWQEKKSFFKSDHIIAVSNYVGETTRELLKLGKREIKVIYNPIDITRFYQSDINKVEKYTVFFAGTLIEKKGIRQLIESLEYLVDEFPYIKLKIAGRDSTLPGTNTPYRPILESSITKKIAPHIEFLGVLPNFELPSYIESANVCCYPSHMEAMPLAWLEVLAMGKIFIGSETGPGKEVIRDEITGLLCNPYEPKSIAEKIKWVFNNMEMSNKIGLEARKDAQKRFNIEKIVDENISYYKRIINN